MFTCKRLLHLGLNEVLEYAIEHGTVDHILGDHGLAQLLTDDLCKLGVSISDAGSGKKYYFLDKIMEFLEEVRAPSGSCRFTWLLWLTDVHIVITCVVYMLQQTPQMVDKKLLERFGKVDFFIDELKAGEVNVQASLSNEHFIIDPFLYTNKPEYDFTFDHTITFVLLKGFIKLLELSLKKILV